MSQEGAASTINYPRLLACVILAVVLGLCPPPAGVNAIGWQITAVFIATIFSFFLRPMPMGPSVLLALIALSATGTLSFKEAFAGFGNKTVWLVVAAFLLAGTLIKSGLGRRVALNLVAKLGKSTLGLGYAIATTELILGPLIPSNTARGGGVMAPIVHSLSCSLDSTPEKNPRHAGSFLVLVGAHANLIAAAMFLTGMAANPLVSEAAKEIFQIDFGWNTWALGALVPGLVGMALLPWVIFRLEKPMLDDAQAARAHAIEALNEMGPWQRKEKIMAGVFLTMILLWATKSLHGLGAGMVAWIGVMILLLTHVEDWKGVCARYEAWDALIWLGGLLTMATALKTQGVIHFFAESVKTGLSGVEGLTLVLILALIYFYSMYAFSMLTAHITALIASFFVVALAVKAPAMLVVAILAYFSNLCASTTHYSTGPVVIYAGLGYVPIPRWLKIGFVVSVFHLAVWLGVGLPWWKLLGWW